jgi:hypothetical protein
VFYFESDPTLIALAVLNGRHHPRSQKAAGSLRLVGSNYRLRSTAATLVASVAKFMPRTANCTWM